jgi:hypothetical protein
MYLSSEISMRKSVNYLLLNAAKSLIYLKGGLISFPQH